MNIFNESKIDYEIINERKFTGKDQTNIKNEDPFET
jgi:hypothetical protein